MLATHRDSNSSKRRVIVLLDLDCFYAQVKARHQPAVRGKVMGVTQKYLVVTSNYIARRLGVPKMVGIGEVCFCNRPVSGHPIARI